MFPVLPPPSDAESVNHLWDELVLGVDSITWGFLQELVEDFWPKVVSSLSKIKDIEITVPTEESWFHIRRACYNNTKSQQKHYAGMSIDVLRLKKGVLSDQKMEDIRLLASTFRTITCAGWIPVKFDARHDNAFLSFLQKLSVLRARDRIYYNGYLAQIHQDDYDKDLFCQEAYKVMTNPNREWYRPLTPWFNHMASTNMDNYRTHEYAHWFGHILSGWPDDT